MIAKPNSRRNLDLALERLYGRGREAQQARTAMANVIVGQLLPGGAVKGGSALRLRYGYAGTRFTTDLDTAREQDIDGFIEDLSAALESGWEGFTGTVAELDPARPEDVPDDYVMRPFAVKLAYNAKSWVTVALEVGHDEIGDTAEPEYAIAEDMVAIFTHLGFPKPEPIPLMPLHHQIAQKLHAVTGKKSQRAHDLVDLQLIAARSPVDRALTHDACIRLFASRRKQTWPPAVTKGEGWDAIYDRAKEDLPVLQSVDEAVDWGNELIRSIDEES
jgi:predicted nucleotidyltransferase component of viral defense system